ncbi:hypothetical protein PILCRDRAFT_810400 [Piloderma croceum F 1598]|uniref:Uncharacterized protein n=1 Tax=Piloderma croceum (strain F 1598) TaxID=765440 RepID=A0A0C3GL87_PILCF|nr:hypothetical protein PILCRDRAFT_810400 [Piloderma croceum F 1598]
MLVVTKDLSTVQAPSSFHSRGAKTGDRSIVDNYLPHLAQSLSAIRSVYHTSFPFITVYISLCWAPYLP